ncbi:MAG: OmpH family outer membrane protein [Proteobacteria bacterium]|nr:OmpH family outer membrane protein [Pseudomonadota bacterium]MBU1745557.1 OmpH family outer membrane protein [Pseudomonadota bacterium]MBU1966577.1 OmpH family outer membrane protein [Pseudomonadota bacterium]
MKRYGWFVAAILIPALAFAASPAAAVEKIGFINVQEVMVTSNAGKKETDDIKKSVDKTKAIIKERENELTKLKGDLEKQRPLLKEEALKEKEIAYQKKFRDYQLLVKDSNEELQAKEQEILKKMIPEILKLVQAIGEKEKYSMIVDISQVPIAYHSKENDVTKRVIEEFNRTYKPKK